MEGKENRKVGKTLHKKLEVQGSGKTVKNIERPAALKSPSRNKMFYLSDWQPQDQQHRHVLTRSSSVRQIKNLQLDGHLNAAGPRLET